MFPTRYFADRYFAPRYFPKVGADPPPVTGQSPRASRYRSCTNTRMVYRFAGWLMLIGGLS